MIYSNPSKYASIKICTQQEMVTTTESKVMKPEQSTLEQVRLKVRELRSVASRLFQAGEGEQASELFEHAVRLEDLIAHFCIKKN